MGRLFLLIAILLAALTAINDTVSAEPKDNPLFLADLRYEITDTHADVVLATNKRIDIIHYTFEDPYRIVIELIGVIFCELEQKIEIKEGPVESISIVEDKTISKPSGLDKYFYAVDYITIQLREKCPFKTFTSKDGKVIIARIKTKATPDEIAGPLQPAEGDFLEPVIIEEIEYQVSPQSSVITVLSNKDLKATTYEQYAPYQIGLTFPSGTFCELEERMEPIDGLIKSITIIKDVSQREFEAPDKFFYPVKNIIIEPIVQLPFSVRAANDGRITVVQIQRTEAAPAVEEVIEPEVAPLIEPVETVSPELPMAAKKIMPDEKQEIVDEITQKLFKKQEELFAKKEQEEERKKAIREARDKATAIRTIEKIGTEELQDLMVKGEGIATLDYCQDTALSYSEPAAIAEEEIKFSSMKLKENFRALFPGVKLKASRTTGDVLGQADFTEQLYGIEAEHPVYQGGKLWHAYQQSKVNLNLSKARYDKVVNDLDYKVAEAYYSVVTSVMNLKLQQKLLKEAEQILNMAQKRRSEGLSTDLEIFNVKSQYNQVQFQLASAERDLALARFKLEQAIGLDIAEERIDLGEVETELKFEIVDINLDKCLELAQEHHPDIVVNELLVESNEYEEKIQRAKDSFKIDLTGFYGRSGSWYETEEEKMDRDWNVGVKVSKPFWGNTAAYSFTKEETKRKIGLTDRTGTEVHSGEFNILDAMGVASDIQEARVKRHKAENELLEARRQVGMEVKEAYYNYQEAVIQVKNSLEKVRFQQEAVKTARAQAELNEALQSQVIEAETKLADERSLYIKALSDYNFSLAKLNKAIGIKDYFSIGDVLPGDTPHTS